MTIRVPPRTATWLLKHLGPRYRSESLAGDLFEEYQQNRTPGWYWRQAAAAILVGGTRLLRVRLPRFVLTAVLRALIEFGIVLGGIALAESKAMCPGPLRACHSNTAHSTNSPTLEQIR
jgi:hypothetical protein